MNKEKYIIRIISFILLIPMGIFMFVFGGYDDSPGAQLIGFVLVTIAIIGILKAKKKK